MSQIILTEMFYRSATLSHNKQPTDQLIRQKQSIIQPTKHWIIWVINYHWKLV